MSVVAQRKKFTQDPVKLLKSNRDYVTGMETCEFTYEWTINGVEYDPKEIKSPKFSSHYSDFNDEWVLKIDPNNSKLIRRMTCVPMQLQPTSFSGFNDTSQLQTKYGVKFFVNEKEWDRTQTKDDYTAIFTDKLSKKVYLRIDFFGSLTLKGLLNDKLLQKLQFKICCIIKMSKKLTNNSDVTSKFTATQQLSADLEKLLLNDKSTDFTIKVGQKSFRAIKGILEARSPVFAAIVNNVNEMNNKS
ncbi:uncharacterized protein LOC122853907 [Aphidius gifuensis]|uniref:uncharacterized protein LOC122853907 n=1 Tax=Aphidius gifuensis TaxID=684658 RepID=UPI001CDD0051|nr:uncharacterized protein LOC122853907 [Aphidius gifuensis]